MTGALIENIPSTAETKSRWYAGITRYQWLVLVIASLGWVFDVFEGQIFVASMNEAMPSLLPEHVRTLGDAARKGYIAWYNNITFAAFLLGGALGGVVFGIVSDRIGRKKTMSLTIILYSLFTFVSALSQAWWHMAVFRFLVALGVGGEWAVASTLVAEVFPKRARAWSLGIFHASSVLGTFLAVAAGAFLIGNPQLFGAWAEKDPSIPWRVGFMVGVLPSLLIIWIRRSLKEPEQWQQARQTASENLNRQLGAFGELFGDEWRRRTVIGVGLAAIGLATFWGVHIYGKDLMRNHIARSLVPQYGPDSTKARESQHPELQSMVEQAWADMTRTMDIDLDRAEETSLLQATAAAFLAYDLRTAPLVQQRHERNGRIQFSVVAAQIRVPGSTDPATSTADVEIISPRRGGALAKELCERVKARLVQTIKRWEMFGMLVTTTGGGLGLICFGPICEWLGRRLAFCAFHLGGLVSALLAFQVLTTAPGGYFAPLPSSTATACLAIELVIFGFLTLGMHAGYAIYFPELFPTRLRATGAGFCFNFGRILAAPILFISGWMQRDWGFSLENAASLLALLYLIGAVLPFFGPETRGAELPE
jgi:MFS family permease